MEQVTGTEIDPRAEVSPEAVIGDGCRIGPWAVIGPQVKLGPGCTVGHHATVDGESTLGPRNHVHPYAYVGAQTQDLKYAGGSTRLEVGEGNNFREFCTVHRATADGDATIIGNHNHFLSYTHVGHDCVVGDHVILSNNGTLAGHVIVEDYAIVGGLCAIHQFCRIGAHAILGGCAKVVQDVPPYLLADGNPATVRALNLVGLKRRGFDGEAIRRVKELHRILYRSGLNRGQAESAIADHADAATPEFQTMLTFVKASERGLA